MADIKKARRIRFTMVAKIFSLKVPANLAQIYFTTAKNKTPTHFTAQNHKFVKSFTFLLHNP